MWKSQSLRSMLYVSIWITLNNKINKTSREWERVSKSKSWGNWWNTNKSFVIKWTKSWKIYLYFKLALNLVKYPLCSPCPLSSYASFIELNYQLLLSLFSFHLYLSFPGSIVHTLYPSDNSGVFFSFLN